MPDRRAGADGAGWSVARAGAMLAAASPSRWLARSAPPDRSRRTRDDMAGGWHLGTAADGRPVTLDDEAILGNIIVRHARDTAMSCLGDLLMAQAVARGLGVIHLSTGGTDIDEGDALSGLAAAFGRADDVLTLDWSLVGRTCDGEATGHGWDPLSAGTAEGLSAVMSDALGPGVGVSAVRDMLLPMLDGHVGRRDGEGVPIPFDAVVREVMRMGAARDERRQEACHWFTHAYGLLADHLGRYPATRRDIDLADVVRSGRLLTVTLPDETCDRGGTQPKAGLILGCLGLALAGCRASGTLGTLLVVDGGSVGLLPAMSRIASRVGQAGVGMVGISRVGGQGRFPPDAWEPPGAGSAFGTRCLSRLACGHPAFDPVEDDMRAAGIPAGAGRDDLEGRGSPSTGSLLLRADGTVVRYEAAETDLGMMRAAPAACLL